MNHLGEQVLVDGQSPATIRYLGRVDGHPGEWIGVEWWNQQGKHNGTFQGKVYFQTKNSLGGSFVRPERISRGHSFTDAIQRQYIKSSQEEYQQKQIDYSLFGKEYSDYRIELSSLLRIDLSCQWVDRFDDENEEIYENLRQIKELNLRQNLLERWSQFWPIFAKYFSDIEILNLSNCRMLVDVSSSSRVYPRLQQLVLIDTNNDCSVFEKILRSFPNLVDLYLDLNSLTHLSSTLVDQCRHLRLLSLSDNPSLDGWNPSVNRLGRLPFLEELFLNNCSIKTIEIDSDFPRLTSLYLSDNHIDSFRSIDELSRLPSLRSLSLLRNPLYPSTPIEASTAKQLIVARLPNLTHFNRVFIPRDERRGAEIDYLQRHAKDYFQCSTNFDVEHRQFRKLIEKYGEPNQPGEEKNEKKGLVIRSNLFSIEFQLEGEKSIVKKIPSSMTISKLKTFVKKLYPLKLTDRSIQLYFVLDAEHRQILGDDYQDIHFYFDGQLKTSTIQIHLI